MKKQNVPQDKSPLENKNMRELYYALDENGNYTTVHSTGWQPKTIALNQALEELETRIAAAKARVQKGISSPIEYYMELNKMDVPILAAYVNMWRWRVKRHLKPKVFNKLPDKILRKYAEVFDISLETLKQTDRL